MVAAGVGAYTDSWSPRGIYYYELFARSEVGNYSPPAAENARATNYILGDVVPPYDGLVGIPDITALGDSYGVGCGHPYFNAEVDVGPTDTALGDGVPLPDCYVGFEDILIFGFNFSGWTAARTVAASCQNVELAWVQESDLEWSCHLNEPCVDLKGLHLTGVLPAGVQASVVASALVEEQIAPVFLRNAAPDRLDVAVVVLGSGQGVVGAGELFRLSLTGAAEIRNVTVEARDLANEPLAYTLSDRAEGSIPKAFRLAQNYPNPFNPMTTIAFDLPEAQKVDLAVYGIDGRRIRRLVADSRAAGRYEVIWNGTDDAGRVVASGTYFCRIVAGPYSSTHKMILMK